MGLDQYAYVAAAPGQRKEFWSNLDSSGVSTVSEPREIAYWRKHPNLHGWMEQLWIEKGYLNEYLTDKGVFNGVELELTWEDLDRLEKDILLGNMAKLETTGFFFGSPSDDEYRKEDLAFVVNAKAEIFLGLRVFYNSSW